MSAGPSLPLISVDEWPGARQVTAKIVTRWQQYYS